MIRNLLGNVTSVFFDGNFRRFREVTIDRNHTNTCIPMQIHWYDITKIFKQTFEFISSSLDMRTKLTACDL